MPPVPRPPFPPPPVVAFPTPPVEPDVPLVLLAMAPPPVELDVPVEPMLVVEPVVVAVVAVGVLPTVSLVVPEVGDPPLPVWPLARAVSEICPLHAIQKQAMSATPREPDAEWIIARSDPSSIRSPTTSCGPKSPKRITRNAARGAR
jgi:hypothetical protein